MTREEVQRLKETRLEKERLIEQNRLLSAFGSLDVAHMFKILSV